MIRKLNLHWIEWTVVIVVIMLIVFAVAGNTGAVHWIKQGLHLAGQGLGWFVSGVQQLVNSVSK